MVKVNMDAEKQQSGYVLIFVLIVLILAISISTVSMQTAFLERKQSEYSLKWKQALQASQAGIEETMERAYSVLLDQAGVEMLPDTVIPAGGPYSISADADCFYQIEPDGVVLESFSTESCSYDFICTGASADSRCRIIVSCEYLYEQIYEEDGNGQNKYVKRTFRNRGRITKCEIEW